MAPLAERAVEPVELACHLREALAFGLGVCSLGFPCTELRVLGEPGDFGTGELGLAADARRRRDCALGRRCFEPHALEPGERRDEDARLGEQRCSRSPVPCRPHAHSIAQRTRDGWPTRKRLRAKEQELPVRQLLQRAKNAAQQGALVRSPLEHDQVAFASGPEELRIDALADDPIVPGEAVGCCLRRLLAGRHERVDPSEQSIALRSPGWIAEPFGIQKCRHGHGLRVAQRQIRK